MRERRRPVTNLLLSLILPGLVLVLSGAGPGEPPLVEAARRDLGADALRSLLAEGANVNDAYGDGATALHWASHWNDLESAELLIRAGANVNAVNDLGVTPLWLAALNSSDSIAARLLAAGADPNKRLLRGETVLMEAARTGNARLVGMLLDAGADINAAGPIQDGIGPCPLPNVYALQPLIPNVNFGLTAEELKRISGMQCGLQAGNQTALMWAASNRHPQVVDVLIRRGADIHARSDVFAQVQAAENPHAIYDHQRSFLQGGMTAFLFAARVGDFESAKLLVAAGADVNETDARGVTALSLASWAVDERTFVERGLAEQALALVEFLLEKGADPNPTTGEFSPLHVAVMSENAAMTQLLLEHGADPNQPLRGWTAVSRGPIKGFRNFSYPLVGASPLWLAAKSSTPEIMRILVEKGADPLFVLNNQYYRGGGGGIDVNINYESSTILLAALNQGGRASDWDGPPPREDLVDLPGTRREPPPPDPEILEKVKLAVEWGVDVNYVGETLNTCVVPWQDSYRPGERRPCDGSSTVTRRTAIEAAGNNQPVIDYLLSKGAVPPAAGAATGRAGGGRGDPE